MEILLFLISDEKLLLCLNCDDILKFGTRVSHKINKEVNQALKSHCHQLNRPEWNKAQTKSWLSLSNHTPYFYWCISKKICPLCKKPYYSYRKPLFENIHHIHDVCVFKYEKKRPMGNGKYNIKVMTDLLQSDYQRYDLLL